MQVCCVKVDFGSQGPCRVLITPGNLEYFNDSYLAVSRQSTVAFGRSPRIFKVKVNLDPRRHSSSRNAWLDSGYMLCVSLGACGRSAHISNVKKELGS